jgi:hypothetical protein
MQDGTALGKLANWTCFESFGNCDMYPVVRCTWSGNHDLPLLGTSLCGPDSPLNSTVGCRIDKKNFFAGIAWEFFSKFWIPVGSEKERRLLLADETNDEAGERRRELTKLTEVEQQ